MTNLDKKTGKESPPAERDHNTAGADGAAVISRPFLRIKTHPIIDRFPKGPAVAFQFEGKPLQGHEGEPIAAALHAAGIRVLGHSRRLGRPRGFFCAIGKCSSCLMRVDGVDDVMVCITPLRAGMVVERLEGGYGGC